jgi:hypothetical protein
MLVVAVPAGGADVPFTPRVVDFDADGASDVGAADVNGDGHLDLVAAAADDARVAWYEGGRTAPPAFPRHVITSTAPDVAAVHAVDLDGDDDVDVLVASGGDDTIAWYENDGDPIPGFTRHVITDTALRAADVWTADLDGDDDLDVVSASSEDGTIAWYRNDGAEPPGFTERVITTAAAGAVSVHAADVDGDGDVDVLSASSFGRDRIAWYENDGAMTPSFSEHVIATDAVGAADVRTAHLNGDSFLDVISASGFDDTIAWYENDGATPPVFTKRVITTSAAFARCVHAADVDGDGDQDVLSASSGDDTVAWYDNEGGNPPTFVARTISTGAGGAQAVHAADLDGDGDTDVASASSIDGRVRWFENEQMTACPADLDGDGVVGFGDLLIVLATWGPCVGCTADIDDDRIVGFGDLLILLSTWGPCRPGPFPEPP